MSFFYVRHGNDERTMFNMDCMNCILLDKIKLTCQYMDCDIVDLVNGEGECLFLHTRLNEYGNQSLRIRDAYILCKVTVEKRPLTEDEIEELDNVKNNIKGKKKTKKVDIENLVIENGYVVNKQFQALLETEEGRNLEINSSKKKPSSISSTASQSQLKPKK